ncbi:MAG: hypothetical protein KGH69_00995 [Candidatus Micrarchaeota archaeon]|nr:hypothetical protein [Candidatus Micrarchaeota archaeon]
MERKSNNRATVRKASLHRLFFIRPTDNANLNRTILKLLKLEEIKEVLVSEGDYGLIVNACQNDGNGELHDYLSKNFKGRFRKAICHYSYKR